MFRWASSPLDGNQSKASADFGSPQRLGFIGEDSGYDKLMLLGGATAMARAAREQTVPSLKTPACAHGVVALGQKKAAVVFLGTHNTRSENVIQISAELGLEPGAWRLKCPRAWVRARDGPQEQSICK